VNEKSGTIAELWDGTDLKCTFKRTVGGRLWRIWLEVIQLASTIVLEEGGEDELIWMFNSKGVYTLQSLYKVINFRGVTPVHVPRIWSLHVPPRVQFFLWLLFNNKVLTRYDLSKRQHVDDKTCLFCREEESSQHLLFECVVTKRMWDVMSSVVNRQIGRSFEDIGVCWLSSKKFTVTNMLSPAGLWAIWKLRNFLCFQNGMWRNMQQLLFRVVGLAQNWRNRC
jgi:hypothetical protein